MKFIFATHNQAKLNQVRNILRLNNIDIELISEKDIGFDIEVEETGTTFEENSLIKANAVYDFCEKNNIKDVIIFADDAGLCVDKLDGAPGVYSARFAGEGKTDHEKREIILNALKDYNEIDDRKAEFISVITAKLPNGEIVQTKGESIGHIPFEESKVEDKLTYCQIFVPNGFDKAYSEFTSEDYKHVEHHREIAFKKLIQILKEKEVI